MDDGRYVMDKDGFVPRNDGGTNTPPHLAYILAVYSKTRGICGGEYSFLRNEWSRSQPHPHVWGRDPHVEPVKKYQPSSKR